MSIKTDRNTYLPSPATITPGPAGWSFVDGLSGIKITRLTDERDGPGFGTTYAIWPTANKDATKLWVYGSVNNSYWTMGFDPVTGTRTGTLKPVAPAPAKLFANYESFLWSGLDADKGFMVVDAKIYSYRPSTNTYTLIKDLTPALGTETFYTQQHKSVDDKRIAAAGRFGFMVYDVEQDRILLDVRTPDMNGIALDRTGKWLLYVPSDDHVEYVYNVETGTRERITSDRSTGLPDFTIGHLDVGADTVAGNDRWAGAITMRKLSAPHTFTRPFVYAQTGWLSHHVSMTANDGNWALLSTYGDIVGPRDGNGNPVPPFDPDKFKGEVFQIGIQGDAAGKIRRLFHHRANWSGNYWDTPRANISPDGRFVFITSNMGGTRNDLYVADLGAVTPPTPIPTPPTPSPDPTKGTTITDASGGVWTLGAGQETLRNGTHIASGFGTVYKWMGGVVYVLGTNGWWYKWTGSAWQSINSQQEPGTQPTTRVLPWPKQPGQQNALLDQQWATGRYRLKRVDGNSATFEVVN